MNITVFSTKLYDKRSFLAAVSQRTDAAHLRWHWLQDTLSTHTARFAKGSSAVCCFVNDTLDADCLQELAHHGVKLVCLRCAGFNQVDLVAAKHHDIQVVRVPEYSPHSVAEHTVGLMVMLNRHLHKAYNRVREGNFSLEGLLGIDFHGLTAGVIGTGKIGCCVISILQGFGCNVLAFDPKPRTSLEKKGVRYCSMDDLLQQSSIVTLHCPLSDASYHLINKHRIEKMQHGVMLINTSRGGLIDTKAVIHGLKVGQIGSLGLDVYEEEASLFFEDKSSSIIQDDTFMRLLTFPNVVVTGHQAFFTRNAFEAIANHTVENLVRFSKDEPLKATISAQT